MVQMINLDTLTIFNDVRERLAQITPEHVASAERRINKQKHKDKPHVIGVIESEGTKALYALWILLDAETAMQKALAQSATDSAIEREHMERAAVCDMISDVVGEMFWSQAKIDLGFYEFAAVGIRPGWQLVKEPPQHPLSLAGILGGNQS